MSMPEVDGFEATRAIRQLEQSGLQPSQSASKYQKSLSESGSRHRALIIALTGLAGVKYQDAAYEAGADIFLMKPVKFGKLAELLTQWEQGKLAGGGNGEKEAEAS